jgi:hypothetical protein
MVSPEETQSVLDPVPASAPPTAAAGKVDPLWPTVLRVAWLSIGLGLAMEVVLLVLAAFTDTAGATPLPFVSDLAQKIAWSFIVCVGLAFGSTASKAREGLMGLLGLISAPVGFGVARAVHKAAKDTLGVVGTAAGGASPLLIGGLKGIEYAVFGVLLAWIGKRALGLGAHLGAGLAIGLTFGLGIVAATVQVSATAPVDLIARGINEVLFPVGCALVLYASGALSNRLPG